jgi:phosphatidylserine/phosphatidylglycerophosphate/cardiolipin synthase-like enzyme
LQRLLHHVLLLEAGEDNYLGLGELITDAAGCFFAVMFSIPQPAISSTFLPRLAAMRSGEREAIRRRSEIDAAFGLATPYTSGNKVEPLVDGETYMFDLYKQFSALGPNDILLIAGWEFSTDRFLWANDKANSMLHRVLRNLVGNRIKVGLIAFNNPIPTLGPGKFVAAVNEAQQGTAVMDGTKVGTAHHEKVVFVGGQTFERSCAYVGGIDLSVDRLDSSKHERAEEEKRQWGWHDIAVKVGGRAVMQIWANFADRWDSIHRIYGQQQFASPAWAQNAAGLQLVKREDFPPFIYLLVFGRANATPTP